jgi:hypothetical protein
MTMVEIWCYEVTWLIINNNNKKVVLMVCDVIIIIATQLNVFVLQYAIKPLCSIKNGRDV